MRRERGFAIWTMNRYHRFTFPDEVPDFHEYVRHLAGDRSYDVGYTVRIHFNFAGRYNLIRRNGCGLDRLNSNLFEHVGLFWNCDEIRAHGGLLDVCLNGCGTQISVRATGRK